MRGGTEVVPLARPTRVVYVENDPTLRSLVARALGNRTDLTITCTAGSSDEVLSSDAALVADVALLDQALGPDSLTGVELGIALRDRNENIGIVVYSHYSIPDYARRMDERMSQAWSFVEKTGNLDFNELAEILKETAAGKSVTSQPSETPHPASHVADHLTPRQHQIMSLAVQGFDAPTIASHLGCAPVTVRKNLSRVYEVLVPDPPIGADLRTLAVLRYAQEVRGSGGHIEPR